MAETLTGRAAAEALGAYLRIANSGASFNAARVARAVRCQKGRRRLTGAVATMRKARSTPTMRPVAARRCSHQAARRVASVAAERPPGRPRRAGVADA